MDPPLKINQLTPRTQLDQFRTPGQILSLRSSLSFVSNINSNNSNNIKIINLKNNTNIIYYILTKLDYILFFLMNRAYGFETSLDFCCCFFFVDHPHEL